jgi:hypothetical protein
MVEYSAGSGGRERERRRDGLRESASDAAKEVRLADVLAVVAQDRVGVVT